MSSTTLNLFLAILLASSHVFAAGESSHEFEFRRYRAGDVAACARLLGINLRTGDREREVQNLLASLKDRQLVAPLAAELHYPYDLSLQRFGLSYENGRPVIDLRRREGARLFVRFLGLLQSGQLGSYFRDAGLTQVAFELVRQDSDWAEETYLSVSLTWEGGRPRRSLFKYELQLCSAMEHECTPSDFGEEDGQIAGEEQAISWALMDQLTEALVREMAILNSPSQTLALAPRYSLADSVFSFLLSQIHEVSKGRYGEQSIPSALLPNIYRAITDVLRPPFGGVSSLSELDRRRRTYLEVVTHLLNSDWLNEVERQHFSQVLPQLGIHQGK